MTFRWVNDQRLVFDLEDRQLAQGAQRYGAGLYAVNADGGNYRQLVTRNHMLQNKRALLMLPWNTYLLSSIGDQQSDDVYVTQPDFSQPGNVVDEPLMRLNTSHRHLQDRRRSRRARATGCSTRRASCASCRFAPRWPG